MSCLSGCLSHQSAVGAAVRRGGSPENEAEELAFPPASIESIDELVQVALEVLLAP